MSLYKIEEKLLSILTEIDDNEGELTPELEESLVIAQEDFESKMYGYSIAVRELGLSSANATSELLRISKYKDTLDNKIQKLKTAMLDAVMLFGNKDHKGKEIWRFQAGTFKMNTSRSVSTEIFDEALIEDKWKRLAMGNLSLKDKVKILEAIDKEEEDVKIVIDILKTPIKEAIERGELVEGARLKTNYNLQIK